MVELDLGHLEAAGPLGLVPQTIIERTARVLLANFSPFFRSLLVSENEAAGGSLSYGFQLIWLTLLVSREAFPADEVVVGMVVFTSGLRRLLLSARWPRECHLSAS